MISKACAICLVEFVDDSLFSLQQALMSTVQIKSAKIGV